MDPADAERNLLLDHMESTGTALTTRGVLDVLILPLTRQLRTPEGRRSSGSALSSSTTRGS